MRAEQWLNEFQKDKAPRNATGYEPEHSIRLGPNIDSYNFFLMCVSKGEVELIERVTSTLKSMELYQQCFKVHVQANIMSYSIAIDSSYISTGIKAKEYFRI